MPSHTLYVVEAFEERDGGEAEITSFLLTEMQDIPAQGITHNLVYALTVW